MVKKNKYTIQVTQEDIAAAREDGFPKHLHCPIARAATRTFGKVMRCGAMYLSEDSNNNLGVELPEEARSFVKAFDYHGEVKPFEFTVEVPW